MKSNLAKYNQVNTLGLINVLSMYLLIKFTTFGMYAVVITTSILNLVHFIDAPLYATYCLKLPYKTFYPTIMRHLLNTVILMLVAYGINFVWPIANNWIALLIKILFY